VSQGSVSGLATAYPNASSSSSRNTKSNSGFLPPAGYCAWRRSSPREKANGKANCHWFHLLSPRRHPPQPAGEGEGDRVVAVLLDGVGGEGGTRSGTIAMLSRSPETTIVPLGGAEGGGVAPRHAASPPAAVCPQPCSTLPGPRRRHHDKEEGG
jgi:hypothetical protein